MFISQKSIQKIYFLSTDIWPLEQCDVSFDLLGPAISKGTNDSRGFVRQLERAHIFISVLLYTEASQLYRCCRTRVGLCCCFCVWSEGVKVCIIGGHCQNEQWRGQTKAQWQTEKRERLMTEHAQNPEEWTCLGIFRREGGGAWESWTILVSMTTAY